MTSALADGLKGLGINVLNTTWFDTLTVEMSEEQVKELQKIAKKSEVNFYYASKTKVGISLDETTNDANVNELIGIFAAALGEMLPALATEIEEVSNIPAALVRTSDYLTHPVSNTHHSETAMMRYIKQLENKDLSFKYVDDSFGFMHNEIKCSG